MAWPWQHPKPEPPRDCAHTWTPWERVAQGDIMGASLLWGSLRMGWWLLQERRCVHCGYRQRDKQLIR